MAGESKPRGDVVESGWLLASESATYPTIRVKVDDLPQMDPALDAVLELPAEEPSSQSPRRIGANIVRRPGSRLRAPGADPRAPRAIGNSSGSDHGGASHSSDRQEPGISITRHNLTAGADTDQRLVMVLAPDGEEAAAYRLLRHRIVAQQDPQVIVVASPRPEERKTTVAVNLAIALGEYRRASVLMLDANFSQPALARLLGFEPPACFAEQLATHKDAPFKSWSVTSLVSQGVHVMALDPDKPQERLDAPAFAFAVQQMRAVYDYIVVDAPPVLGSAEVNVLQEASDGVVITVRKGRSTRKDLRSCFDQLTGATVLGVVLHED